MGTAGELLAWAHNVHCAGHIALIVDHVHKTLFVKTPFSINTIMILMIRELCFYDSTKTCSHSCCAAFKCRMTCLMAKINVQWLIP